jgi:hypothetical protein
MMVEDVFSIGSDESIGRGQARPSCSCQCPAHLQLADALNQLFTRNERWQKEAIGNITENREQTAEQRNEIKLRHGEPPEPVSQWNAAEQERTSAIGDDEQRSTTHSINPDTSEQTQQDG